MEDGKEGRKSEVLLPLTDNDAVTASPVHQRRRSSQAAVESEAGEGEVDVKVSQCSLCKSHI